MRRITFHNFREYMLGEGYSLNDVYQTYHSVKSMDPETKGWVVDWFLNGIYPEQAVQGVTVQGLVDELHMKPINAFIAIAWLKESPEEAMYYLTRLNTAAFPEKTVAEELKTIFSEEELYVPQPDTPEDLTDIEV